MLKQQSVLTGARIFVALSFAMGYLQKKTESSEVGVDGTLVTASKTVPGQEWEATATSSWFVFKRRNRNCDIHREAAVDICSRRAFIVVRPSHPRVRDTSCKNLRLVHRPVCLRNLWLRDQRPVYPRWFSEYN